MGTFTKASFPFFPKSNIIPKQSISRRHCSEVHCLRSTWTIWNETLWSVALKKHCGTPRKILPVRHCPTNTQGMSSVWGSQGEPQVDPLFGRREGYCVKDKEMSLPKRFSERSGGFGWGNICFFRWSVMLATFSYGCLLAKVITLL